MIVGPTGEDHFAIGKARPNTEKEGNAMQKAHVNGVELEYEEQGTGEPILLVPNGPFADSFVPFMSAPPLAGRYRLIRYHQRGQAGSTPTTTPVSFADHAADAAALLTYLEVDRAHVVGHSTGATIVLQLTVDRPDIVQTLALLEPPLVAATEAAAFFEKAGPALSAYGSGDREAAMASFLSAVSGLGWEECQGVLEQHAPGSVAQAAHDADNFFGSILPALNAWPFGAEQAATISQPVISLLGAKTEPWFAASHELLTSWVPQLEECTIDRAGHLLQMQHPEPVAQALAAFFARHPIGPSPA